VAILNFMASQPDRSFSMSALSRHTGISKATLHEIVRVLVDAGYLARSSDRLLTLGPALVWIGAAAVQNREAVVQAARPVMNRLADKTGLQCIAAAALGHEIVVLASVGRHRSRSLWYQEGERIPFIPPLGAVYLAWAAEADVDTWLNRGGLRAQPGWIAELRAGLRNIREQRYAIALTVNARAELQKLLHHLDMGVTVGETRRLVAGLLGSMADDHYLAGALREGDSYQVDYISAPVFDRGGRVCLSLNLAGISEPVGDGVVRNLGELVVAAADEVTAAIGGSVP
jgi:DNA-binding IclR family transcriptional regulator